MNFETHLLDGCWSVLVCFEIPFFGVGARGRRPVSPPTPEGRGVRVNKGEQLFEKKLLERKIVSRKAT